jgi:hypothetical protein
MIAASSNRFPSPVPLAFGTTRNQRNWAVVWEVATIAMQPTIWPSFKASLGVVCHLPKAGQK